MGDCKIGLALGGGSARGWAHIGVLRALNAAGIHPDIIAGTSIGAVVGGCYVAGELGALEQFARELTRRKVLGFLDFNFSGSGLINGQRLCDILNRQLKGITIEAMEKRFVAVATEIGTGHEVWLSHGRLVDADLADGRADGAQGNAVLVEQCLEFVNLEVGQGEDVGLEDGAELQVADAALLEHGDLLLGVGGDFVGEGG